MSVTPATPVTVYGIRNCDTLKKSLHWLDEHAVAHTFHDYRKQGLSGELLEEMIAALGWEALVNRRGTTWRALDEAVRQQIDADSARQLMLDQPALIRRPVVRAGDTWLVGFDAATFSQHFG